MLVVYVWGVPLAFPFLSGLIAGRASNIDLDTWIEAAVLTIFAVWLWDRYGESLVRQMGWVGTSLGDVVRLGAPTIAAILALDIAAGALLPAQLRTPYVPLFEGCGPTATVAVIADVVALAPIIEEWLFRGFLLHSFDRARGGAFALWATSVVFALLHSGIQPLMGALLMGWMLGRWVLAGGSLKAAFWVHLANNALAVLTAPDLSFSGAAQGRTSPAAALALLAVALAIVVLFNRRHPLPAERPGRPAPVFSLSLGFVIFTGVFAQWAALHVR